LIFDEVTVKNKLTPFLWPTRCILSEIVQDRR